MLGALDVRGVGAMMTVEGATDAEVFEAFLERVLIRKLRPGDIVVLDNVGAHKAENIRKLVESAGASMLFPAHAKAARARSGPADIRPQCRCAIWMRLPQVSSNTAVETGPWFTGG